MGKLDEAGRAIAGLIGYNPGPGIYSRLERAIEAMPSNVRVQELPGLLKRHKEGVPSWEVKEVLTPDLTEGVQSIPRQDLLDAVKERSPVYTHKELVLGGRQPSVVVNAELGSRLPAYQGLPSKIGEGISHGEPHYESYGHGGQDYSELLLLQPGQNGLGFGSHWSGRGMPFQDQAVAHARFDTHGDALRINELQSDLGIHNRKIRENSSKGSYPEQHPMELDDDYYSRLEDLGYTLHFDEHGGLMPPGSHGHPFPLEDAWADILIKRLALQAARGGHRAIEIASPRAIADKVGGNIDNYEHFYGKVVPGALERLGRKMGGLELPPKEVGFPYSRALSYRAAQLGVQGEQKMYRRMLDLPSADSKGAYDQLVEATANSGNAFNAGNRLYSSLVNEGIDERTAAEYTSQYMILAGRQAESAAADRHLAEKVLKYIREEDVYSSPGKRYIMSDAMRKAILTGGIGAAVSAPVMSDDDLIERLNQ